MAQLGNARRARLSIPKVQNPNGSITAPTQGHGISNQQGAHSYVPKRGLQTPKGFQSEWGPFKASQTGSTSETAATAAPTATPAPKPINTPQVGTDPFATPAYYNAEGKDPRDATYWNNFTKLQSQDRAEYAANLAEQTKADSAFATATQEALRNRVANQRQIGESTLSNGLADSGYHDRVGTEATTKYNSERSQAQLSKSQEDAARTAARNALAQGYSIEAAALLGEAAGRYAEGHVGEAEEGGPELAPEPSSGAAASNPTKNAIRKSRNSIGNANALRPRQGISNNRRAR